jgi:hypothetical protein
VLLLLWGIKEKRNKKKCDLLSIHGDHHHIMRKGMSGHPHGTRMKIHDQGKGNGQEQVALGTAAVRMTQDKCEANIRFLQHPRGR